jgi:DUF4097 and DUF4098 domain-containing protein YvlB
MTARSDRRVALTVGAVLAVVFIVSTAFSVADWTTGSTERNQTVRFGTQAIPGPVKDLTIDVRSADVTLVPTSTGEVVIDSRASGTFVKPKLQVRPEGARVRVSGGCPDITLGHCSAEIVVHVPAATAINVDAGSGDIAADGLRGAVHLRTASGDVTGANLYGTEVELQSASGDVAVAAVRASNVSARSSSGDVTVESASVPKRIEARTNSGDVAVVVPPGNELYQVNAETNSGDRNVGVATSSRSANVIDAETHSGDVVIDYGP